MMNRILLATNESTDAQILREVLGHAQGDPFTVEWVTHLATGLERLAQGGIDIVLVDLCLADSDGIAGFDQLFAAAPHTPIFTLCGIGEEAQAIEAVERGGQGYLSRGYLGSHLVPQMLRSSVQHKAVEESLFSEKARAEIAVNSISDAVICTDRAGNVDYLNVAAESLTGCS